MDRANAIVPLLAAYGVRRLVSSPSVRCADTLRPYAAWLGRPLRLKEALSEEGYEQDPARAVYPPAAPPGPTPAGGGVQPRPGAA